jgi:hypothetical protein
MGFKKNTISINHALDIGSGMKNSKQYVLRFVIPCPEFVFL